MSEYEKIDSLNKISRSLWPINSKLSRELADEALIKAEDIEYKQGIADALSNIGVLVKREGKQKKPDLLEESYDLYLELDDHERIVEMQMGLANMYRKMGNTSHAVELLLDGTRVAREYVPGELPRLNGTIGDFLYHQEKFQEALKYYLDATRGYEAMPNKDIRDSKTLILNYHFLGLTYAQLGEFDKSNNYLRICERFYMKRNDEVDLAEIHSSIGKYYHLKGQPKEALEYHLKASKVFEERKKTAKLATEYYRLGENYTELGNYDMALKYLEEGKQLANDLDDLELLGVIENQLSIVYEKRGLDELALDHLRQYVKLYQKFYNDKTSHTQEAMKAQYKTETQKQQIEILEKDMELTEAEASLRTTQLYGVLGVGTFIILFSFIIVVLYERRRRDQQLILAQNEEIMDHQDEILRQKDELIQTQVALHQQKIIEHEHQRQLEVNRAWIEGEEQERERLAGELHDQVGSMLSTVKLHLQALEAKVDKLNTETAEQFEFYK